MEFVPQSIPATLVMVGSLDRSRPGEGLAWDGFHHIAHEQPARATPDLGGRLAYRDEDLVHSGLAGYRRPSGLPASPRDRVGQAPAANAHAEP